MCQCERYEKVISGHERLRDMLLKASSLSIRQAVEDMGLTRLKRVEDG